jgi:CheY-like chemotaxis protein
MKKGYTTTAKKPSLPQQTVLMIDDSLDMLELGQDVLENEGFSVLTASSAYQAIDILTQIKKPELVLLDMHLGDMSGFDLMERLEVLEPDITKHIPFVYFSGEENLPKGKNRGSIYKDGNISNLIHEVHRYIEMEN